MSLRNLINKAVAAYGHETARLSFLPENRYNKEMFPATGQYDWFSGQVLYCLIRHLRPRRILEISTACGYVTMFMALALKENNWGMIDTHEIDPKAAQSAQNLINKYELQKFVDFKVGDARETSRNAPSDYGIYFLDSAHTEAFLRWFIETHVLKAARTDSLFHVHDILPRSARVRRWGKPPFPKEKHQGKAGTKKIIKQWFDKVIVNFFNHSKQNDEEIVDIKVYPPVIGQKFQTFDGNITTEAQFGNELVKWMQPRNYAFLYDLVRDYYQLHPKKYYPLAVGRTDAGGHPMEWNESLWCQVAALKEAYRKVI